MKKLSNARSICAATPSSMSHNSARNNSVQVLYLGDKGKLTYASSGRAVSQKIADKLGISKFNFF